jgi:hypothetical protein
MITLVQFCVFTSLPLSFDGAQAFKGSLFTPEASNAFTKIE